MSQKLHGSHALYLSDAPQPPSPPVPPSSLLFDFTPARLSLQPVETLSLRTSLVGPISLGFAGGQQRLSVLPRLPAPPHPLPFPPASQGGFGPPGPPPRPPAPPDRRLSLSLRNAKPQNSE